MQAGALRHCTSAPLVALWAFGMGQLERLAEVAAPAERMAPPIGAEDAQPQVMDCVEYTSRSSPAGGRNIHFGGQKGWGSKRTRKCFYFSE